MNTNSNWPSQKFKSERLLLDHEMEQVSDRQDRVPGFDTERLGTTRVLQIGCGGIGSEIVTGLARKGAGHVDMCDDDVVETSNLSRQYFFKDDLGAPKAICLARNAAREGFLGGTITGHHVAFDQRTGQTLLEGVTLAVCGVDNNSTRATASRLCRQLKIPVVFAAVSEDADFGWVFVQETTGPCVGCVFPRIAQAGPQREPCRATPAVLDILRTLGGLVLYAVDSLVMDRSRRWNFRSVSLVGGVPDLVTTANRRADCRLCGAR